MFINALEVCVVCVWLFDSVDLEWMMRQYFAWRILIQTNVVHQSETLVVQNLTPPSSAVLFLCTRIHTIHCLKLYEKRKAKTGQVEHNKDQIVSQHISEFWNCIKTYHTCAVVLILIFVSQSLPKVVQTVSKWSHPLTSVLLLAGLWSLECLHWFTCRGSHNFWCLALQHGYIDCTSVHFSKVSALLL